jgi:leader peptidase (prepilin peptidase) / N-methyltransferase
MAEVFEELAFHMGQLGVLSVMMALYLGLVTGSFLNVVIYRWPLQRSIVFPGSGCGGCGVPLKLWNNIPVFSYLYQRGMCAFCGAPFSARYMYIELTCGLASLGFLYYTAGFNWLWLYYFVLFCIALAVFFTDLDHWIIPDEINAFGVVFGVAINFVLPARSDMDMFMEFVEFPEWLNLNVVSSLLGAVVGYLFFRFIQALGMLVARQEAMGWGDVKYAAALGAMLGWQMGMAAFFLSFLLGAFFALPLLLSRQGKGKDPIPFGTFMSLAAVPVALWGEAWWDKLLYMEFF